MGKKLVSWALTLCMLLTMLPTMAWAAETKTFNLLSGNVTFDGTKYKQGSNEYTPASSDEKVIITGSGEGRSWHYLKVTAGTANVILKDANINVVASENGPVANTDAGIIRVEGGVLNLELQGTNTLYREKGGLISVGAADSTDPSAAVLNITGNESASLTLTRSGPENAACSAVIGGYGTASPMAGTINIQGGNIIIPEAYQVGIGPARSSSTPSKEVHYDINISGGSVKITDVVGLGAAGIGLPAGSVAASEVNVDITGGNVDVTTDTGGEGAIAIGAASYTQGAVNITIGEENGSDTTPVVNAGGGHVVMGVSRGSWAPGSINILSGKVTVTGGKVGIGASLACSAKRGTEFCEIKISGGDVTVTGSENVAIGVNGPATSQHNENADGVSRTIDASIEISGSAKVTATGNQVGIGMSDMGSNSQMNIVISDTAAVTATATGEAASYGAEIAIGTKVGVSSDLLALPPAANSTAIAITSPNVTVSAAQPIAAATETALAAGTTYTVGDETITLTNGGTVDSSASITPAGAMTIAKGSNVTTITPPAEGSLTVKADGTIDAPAGTQVSVNGGEATTLTDGGKLDASTAVNPDGFTAKLSVDKTAALEGDTVTATIAVAGKAFAASEVTVTYDAEKLTYVETSTLGAEGSATDDGAGTITIVDAGETKTVNEYAITFTAKDVAGDATIDVTSAKFSTKSKAETDDLVDGGDPTAVTVTITETYTVALNVTNGTASDWFTYSTEPVTDGEKYTFNAIADKWNNYDYGAVTYTMGGTEMGTVEVTNKGAYTIPEVTGDIVITAPLPTAKTYDVTVKVTGEADAVTTDGATYGTDYTYTLPNDVAAGVNVGYTYTLASITIGGTAYTGYSVSDRVHTIPGADITGDIVITVTKEELAANQFTVTVEGNGAGDATVQESPVNSGADAVITLTKDDAYENYVVTATMGGVDVTNSIVVSGDTYTVKTVTGNVVFTVTKELKLATPAVSEYVAVQNEKSMWLVTIGNEKLDSRVYTYDGENMFWSDKYSAYCYLVISEDKPLEGLTEEQISAKFALATGTAVEIDYGKNVNMSTSGTVDASDVQLVYNMYNTEYSDFTEDVTMEKFLRADVNFDKVVNTGDATAIVDVILA